MTKIALALACMATLGCTGTLTRDEVLSPSAAAELGSRAHVHHYRHAGEWYWFPGTMINGTTLRTSSGVEQTLDEEDKVSVTVTYRDGDTIEGDRVQSERDVGLIVFGTVLLVGGGAALGGGIAIGSSCHESSTPFQILSGCAGPMLGAVGLGILGGSMMLVSIPVLVSGLDPHAVVKKRSSPVHLSIAPAGLALGGTF